MRKKFMHTRTPKGDCTKPFQLYGITRADQRPATFWEKHTKSGIAQLNALLNGQNFCPKYVRLIWIYQ